MKSVFEKLRFRDGLVCTKGQLVEIEPAFTNSSGVVWPEASTCDLTTTTVKSVKKTKKPKNKLTLNVNLV